jgi:hypothetical protein
MDNIIQAAKFQASNGTCIYQTKAKLSALEVCVLGPERQSNMFPMAPKSVHREPALTIAKFLAAPNKRLESPLPMSHYSIIHEARPTPVND